MDVLYIYIYICLRICCCIYIYICIELACNSSFDFWLHLELYLVSWVMYTLEL